MFASPEFHGWHSLPLSVMYNSTTSRQMKRRCTRKRIANFHIIMFAADCPSSHQTSVQQLRRCLSSTCPRIIQRERDRENICHRSITIVVVNRSRLWIGSRLITKLNNFAIPTKTYLLSTIRRGLRQDGITRRIVRSLFIFYFTQILPLKRFETKWKLNNFAIHKKDLRSRRQYIKKRHPTRNINLYWCW